jgi:hypothetical protein
MTSLVSASQVVTGQVQSLDSVRAHALPSDALIFASATKVQPANQNPGSYGLVESANALTLSTTGSVPVVTQSPFADLYKEGSLYFNGTVGNYVSGTATGLMGTQWNTTGLTVEAWVNYPTFTGAGLASGATSLPYLVGQIQPAGGSIYWALGANTLGYVTFYYNASGNQNITSSIQIATNTWNHIAFSCLPGGATANIYVNGTSVASTSISGTPLVNSTFPLTLGQYNSNSPNLNAYVADVRITTGAALYTGSSFTVPSAPLSPAATGVAQALIRAGANAPYVSNGALTFDRGLKQYMNFGPQTFNIVTQGFTAIWRGQLTGTPGNYETIFEGGLYGTNNGSLFIGRAGTSTGIYFQISASTGTAAAFTVGVASVLTQGAQTVIVARYNPATSLADVWVNGIFQNSASCSPATLVGDRTVSATYVGYPYSTNSFTSMTSNTLAIYNRALSNVEIYNSYLALTTATINAPIEIGDANGTPALSIAGDGRVNVTKLGQTSNVVLWPPAAMTGYVTSINGGTYVASASSENSGLGGIAWYAFDKNSTGTFWISAASYGSTAPYASTAYTTTDVNGTAYLGEWLQIQQPYPVTLTSYSISPGNNAASGQAPAKWAILGSRDGVNWTLVDARAGVTTWAATTAQTFSVSASQAWTYFRCVVSQANGYVGATAVMVFGEWTLYGTADTAQTLTVAQPVTLSYGAQTASLTGISGDKFVPQDFSSSGLNIPAYVVSNTATVANTVAYSSFGPFAGEGSLYFPGAAASSGAYINFPASTPAASMTPVTAFTAETFLYLAGTPTPTYCGVFGSINTIGGSENWGLNLNGTNATFFIWPTSGAVSQITGSATLINSWFHIAVSYDGTTLRLFINGALANSTAMVGTPRFASGSIFLIGTNGVFRTGCPMYMADARIVTGTALYVSAFTPPTGPLQPIQGTTQAGLPYGTVLLLRNAPAPGRIQTTKFSGANSGQVLSFPPAAMTGYATVLNSGYGQGVYVASASSEATAAWYAFDKAVGSGSTSYWSSAGSTYNTSTGFVATSVVTVDVNGTSYAGEWLQIQNPSSIVLSSYSLQARGDSFIQTPINFWVLGSRDGINWSLVDSRTAVSWTVNSQIQAFNTTSTQAFTWYRLVVNRITAPSAVTSLSEWVLNGSIESVNVTADGRVGLGVVAPTRALEVAGDIVCTGTVSAGNPLMFRNALYNGDMRINQRGISTNWASPTAIGTSGTGQNYGLDRMNMARGSFATGGAMAQGTVATADLPYSQGIQYYLRLGRSSGNATADAVYFNQSLETRESLKFAGQTVTLSAYYRTGAGFSGTGLTMNFYYGTGTDQNAVTGLTNGVTLTSPVLSASNAWQRATYTVFIPQTTTQVSIYIAYTPSGTAGANDYFDVTGVQLEKGSVATPFEVRPYATELALCQRYYFASIPGNPGGTGGGTVGAIAFNTTSLMTNMRTPVTLRANPSTYVYNNGTANQLRVTVNGSTVNGTSLTSAGSGVNGVAYLGFSGAVFTAGSAYDFDIVLSAEL